MGGMGGGGREAQKGGDICIHCFTYPYGRDQVMGVYISETWVKVLADPQQEQLCGHLLLMIGILWWSVRFVVLTN